MGKRRVLFLCAGNSARSQMAEGLVDALLGKEWAAYSAGTQPAGYVHPLAVRVMSELGIDLSGQTSKPAEVFRGESFDLVVTVCNDAAENCPLWLGDGEVLHVGFPDPAAATGTDEERLEAFRQVRDAIVREVIGALRDRSPVIDA
jgi:arsenate reductase